ncbi:hypothetical protein BD289DRAFT_194641 [Coniella lustricola]|uniref:Uncharacterized protein n=1 Tax=Coniella lustricola TaxID=2025994 RepID=A0A2T3AM22_9PEZI|nr:hypothetical protein BD289DRAFT_194641 [Coniella lustricola]
MVRYMVLRTHLGRVSFLAALFIRTQLWRPPSFSRSPMNKWHPAFSSCVSRLGLKGQEWGSHKQARFDPRLHSTSHCLSPLPVVNEWRQFPHPLNIQKLAKLLDYLDK